MSELTNEAEFVSVPQEPVAQPAPRVRTARQVYQEINPTPSVAAVEPAVQTVETPQSIDSVFGVYIYIHDDRDLSKLDAAGLNYDILPEPEVTLSVRDQKYLGVLQNEVKRLKDELSVAQRVDLTK